MERGKYILYIFYKCVYKLNPLIHKSRSVALVPENTEDMWHAYNLISEGDFVSCSTIRYAKEI